MIIIASWIIIIFPENIMKSSKHHVAKTHFHLIETFQIEFRKSINYQLLRTKYLHRFPTWLQIFNEIFNIKSQLANLSRAITVSTERYHRTTSIHLQRPSLNRNTPNRILKINRSIRRTKYFHRNSNIRPWYSTRRSINPYPLYLTMNSSPYSLTRS